MRVATPARPRAVAPGAPADGLERVARLAANFVEAGWLTVAVFAALMFQAITLRSFDFPKAIWLLILTPWLVAGALAAVGLGGLTSSEPALSRRRAWLPVAVAAGTAASYAISTALSIAPSVSVWGSRFNTEGLATGLCYLAVFLLVAGFMRRRDQLRRLVDLVLLISIPVCTYGFAQRWGYDPLTQFVSGAEAYTGRVTSVFGQPVYAAGFAAMVIPLTVTRLIEIARSPHDGADRTRVVSLLGAWLLVGAALALLAGFLGTAARVPQLWWATPIVVAGVGVLLLVAREVLTATRSLALAGYAVLLVLQLLYFFFAWSRGPIAALSTAVGIAVFLQLRGRRGVAALAVGMLLSVFTLANVGLAGLVRLQQEGVLQTETPLPLPASGLPGQIPGLSEGGSPAGRSVVWRDASQLVAAGRDGGGLYGGPTPLRPLVGYGPETLSITFESVATAQARTFEPRRMSRAHNELLDIAVNRGLLGLGVWLATLTVLAIAAWRASRAGGGQAGAAAGLAGALSAYVIEQTFEPTDPSLSTYFWLAAGALLSPAVLSRPAEIQRPVATLEARAPGGRGRRRREQRQAPRSEVSTQRPSSMARWAWGLGLAAGGSAVTLAALLATNYDLLGWLVIGWVVAALLLSALALLPNAGIPPSAHAGRLALVGVPLVLFAAYLSFASFRRLEADVFSKYGLDAATRGDVVNGFGLGRNAVALAPDNELYYSNLARVLANAANSAADGPVRPDYNPSLGLIFGIQPQQLNTFTKREILLMIRTVLEQAVQLLPLELDNRLNLAIVYRALGDLGEPGYYERAREQLRTLAKLAPTQRLYEEQLRQLDRKGP